MTIFGHTLLDPWFLLALPALGVAVWRRAAVRRAALPTAAVHLFAGLPRTTRQRLAWLPLALLAASGVALTVALARPVDREVVPMREDGIDIVLAVDVSSSMLQEDMRDDESYRRMDAARDRAQEFAAARDRDRVGVVAFARFAELRCPPTLDEDALGAFLRVLDTVARGSEFDATAIGVALAKAVDVLADSDAESKVVILLSDGENNIDAILPEQAARLAKDAGVRVHTIGLGRGRASLFGFVPLAFESLKMISEKTDGEFFQARNDADLAAVYERIDELETSERQDPRYRTVDRFELPLAVGLTLLLIGVLFEALIVRRVP
ncbi:MAG: aerotolerance regulator BatA [Planctomycetes bacterium]|nr:aerotolerance regulator BatA [Planctomycetota bacterium]